jgi:hypothetical protein
MAEMVEKLVEIYNVAEQRRALSGHSGGHMEAFEGLNPVEQACTCAWPGEQL